MKKTEKKRTSYTEQQAPIANKFSYGFVGHLRDETKINNLAESFANNILKKCNNQQNTSAMELSASSKHTKK